MDEYTEFSDTVLPKRVNNKEKKSVAGNWGKPGKFLKKHTEIKLFSATLKHKSKKKKKRNHSYLSGICPFCESELPVVVPPEYIMSNGINFFRKFNIFRLLGIISKKCHNCGAREVHNCPSCSRKTWFKDNIYKHQKDYCNCGFTGEKLRHD